MEQEPEEVQVDQDFVDRLALGVDQFQRNYSSIDDLWAEHLPEHWYAQGKAYWESVEPNMQGIMGGFSNLHLPDVMFSLKFMGRLMERFPELGRERALDCGAGWGRVTQSVLIKIFERVDINDLCEHNLEKAKQLFKDNPKVTAYIQGGMQELQFQQSYDCIWVQWASVYLTDHDFVNFFKRARKALTQKGFFIVKQNHTKVGFVHHNQDASATRSKGMYMRLFQSAGLKVIYAEDQTQWPSEMFRVRMYCLR